MLEDVGVACVAQAPLEIIKGILCEKLNILENDDHDLIYGSGNCVVIDDKINKSLSDIARKQRILWVYLPVLYINSQTKILHPLHEPYMKLDEYKVGVSGKTIREVSQRLKKDIVEECKESNDNRVLVQLNDEFVINTYIMTSAEAFEQLKAKDGHDIEYLQVPYNPRNIFEYLPIEKLDKIIHESVATDRTVVLSDHNGVHRSAVAIIVTMLISYHRELLQFVDENGEPDFDVQLGSPFTKSFARLPYSRNRETLATLIVPYIDTKWEKINIQIGIVNLCHHRDVLECAQCEKIKQTKKTNGWSIANRKKYLSLMLHVDVFCFAPGFSFLFVFVLFLMVPGVCFVLFWRVEWNVSYVGRGALYSQQLAVILSVKVLIAASC